MLLGLTVIVAVLCCAVCARRVKVVLAVEDPLPAVTAVRRSARTDGASYDTEGLAAGSPLRLLLEGWSSARSRAVLVAQLNEHVSDVGDQLGRLSTVPKAAARIAATTGVLGAIVAIIQALEGGQVSGSRPFAILAAGFVGAVICVLLGRQAERLAYERRAGYNELIRTLRDRLPAQGA